MTGIQPLDERHVIVVATRTSNRIMQLEFMFFVPDERVAAIGIPAVVIALLEEIASENSVDRLDVFDNRRVGIVGKVLEIQRPEGGRSAR